MQKQILSSQINPFVRYIALRKNDIFFSDVKYARDNRLFYFTTDCCPIILNGIEYKISANDILIIPPMCSYHFVNSNMTAEFYLVNFDYTWDASHTVNALPTTTDASQSPISNIVITDFPQISNPFIISIKGLEHSFAQMAELYAKKSLYFRAEMNSLFSLVLLSVFKTILKQNSKHSFSSILGYVQRHCCENITNQNIGDRFNYHPNYLNRLFIRHTGISMHKYILHCRIDKAITLIQEGDYTLERVAEETGWCSLSAFSHYFKKVTGHAPIEYVISKKNCDII